MTGLDNKNLQNIRDRYADRYREFGYSPKTLGWDKGKQHVRFEVLTGAFDVSGGGVLDVGCGFGDLSTFLQGKSGGKPFEYVGIDVVEELVAEARNRNASAGQEYIVGDFLSEDFDRTFDFVVASGVFNHRLEHVSNYRVVEETLAKAWRLCEQGLAFDFLSDRVDYQLEHTFHFSPERILAMGYQFSRNLLLRNDYMPFEFSLIVFKDDSFNSSDTLFRRYKDGNS